MVSGGMTCVKYLLFCFNLLFAISGIAILTVGAIILTAYHHYSEFVDPGFGSAPIVLILVGVFVFIVAFVGCCGAVKENHCMVITFAAILLIIFTIELAAGIAGYLRRADIENMLEKNLNTTMHEYYTKRDVEKSWNIMQHEMRCCGIRGPNDWKEITHNDTLPYTCCPDTQNDGSCTVNTLNRFQTSCYDRLKECLTNYASIIGAVGIGVSLIQLVGVIFSCCLARSIRREYETV